MSQHHLTAWLKDAHAMEQQSTEILKRQAQRLEHYPELRARIEQHLDETQRQAERLLACLERYDADASTVKDFAGALMGNAGALMNAAAEDEVVKNAIGSSTIEHFEIASYRALVVAAEAANDEETARVCREILAEEEAMAAWVDEHLPAVTQQFLARDQQGAPAKR